MALAVSGCGGGGSSSAPEASAAAPSRSASAASHDDPSGGGRTSTRSPRAARAGDDPAGEGSQTKSHAHVVIPKGPPEPGFTRKQREEAVPVKMELKSPVVKAGTGLPGSMPATYTCDGADTSLPLRWSGVPSGTAELVLFVMNLKPVEGKLFFDWAVAGIDPGETGLEAGSLPEGAVVGRNSLGKRGYSICPGEGESQIYVMALYALPKAIAPKSGFDPLVLRKKAMKLATQAGLMTALYTRGRE